MSVCYISVVWHSTPEEARAWFALWAHFTNDFSIVIYIRRKFHSVLVQIGDEWSIWDFAHGKKVMMSRHVQNFRSDMMPYHRVILYKKCSWNRSLLYSVLNHVSIELSKSFGITSPALSWYLWSSHANECITSPPKKDVSTKSKQTMHTNTLHVFHGTYFNCLFLPCRPKISLRLVSLFLIGAHSY